MPGCQIVDAVDLVLGDTGEDVGQQSERIDAVELGRFDQGEGDRRGSTAALGTCEEPVLAADGNPAHGPLGRILVEFEDAVIEVGPQPRYSRQRVVDRGGERRLAGNAGELDAEPGLEIVEQRFGLA